MKNKIVKGRLNKYLIRRILIGIFVAILGVVCCLFIKDLNSNNSYKKIYNVKVGKKELKEMKNSLNIQEVDYKWGGMLVSANNPKKLVIHHAAAENLSPEKIHEMHLSRGWSGIGYHFYIRSDGTIYRGRDENKIGSHVYGNNKDTLGICLEGNFEENGVPKEQLDALINLGTYLSLKYNISDILRHNDLGSTECPGKLFPFTSTKDLIIENIKSK